MTMWMTKWHHYIYGRNPTLPFLFSLSRDQHLSMTKLLSRAQSDMNAPFCPVEARRIDKRRGRSGTSQVEMIELVAQKRAELRGWAPGIT